MHTGDAVKLIDLGAAYRIDQPAATVYGTRGYQAPEIARPRAERRQRRLHRRAHAVRALLHGTVAPAALRVHAARGPTTSRSSAGYDTLLPRCSSARPRPTPTTASSRPTRWPRSCSACCGRWWPGSRAVASPRRASCSRPSCAPRPKRPTGAGSRRCWWRPTIRPPASWRRCPRAAQCSTTPSRCSPRHPSRPSRCGSARCAVLVDRRTGRRGRRRARKHRSRGPVGVAGGVVPRTAPTPARRSARAAVEFDIVYRTVPGELAPHARAGVRARAADDELARAGWYDTVSSTDPSYASAAFGLARCCTRSAITPARSRRTTACPLTSSACTRAAARQGRPRCSGDGVPAHGRTRRRRRRGGRVGCPRVRNGHAWRCALHRGARRAVRAPTTRRRRARSSVTTFTESDLRFGLEAAYRKLARSLREGQRADRARRRGEPRATSDAAMSVHGVVALPPVRRSRSGPTTASASRAVHALVRRPRRHRRGSDRSGTDLGAVAAVTDRGLVHARQRGRLLRRHRWSIG